MSAPALHWSELGEYEPVPHVAPAPAGDPPDPDDPPHRHGAPAGTRLAPPPEGTPVWDEPAATRAQLWRLLRLVLEVLDGRRPPGQLRDSLSGPVFESLLTRSQHTAGRRHRLCSLHTCRPAPGVIELCGTVLVSSPRGGQRAVALAARMEHTGSRWRCTVLRPLLPARSPA